MPALLKNNISTIRAWCMYDWANSAYSLVIVSAIFPVYFAHTAINEQGGDIIPFMGFEVKNSVLFSYAISFIFLVAAVCSPLLSAIADFSGLRKRFWVFFCSLGSVSCALLYFFTKDFITTSVFLFILAGIGYSGSIVFYNAYLPEIATEDQQDVVSAKGFSYGYIGSVLLLIFNLSMLLMPQWYGNVAGGTAARLSFLSVGIWWLGFSFFPFLKIPETKPQEGFGKTNGWLFNGYKELQLVFSKVKTKPVMGWFLASFFFYNMGVQTVMYVATIFAEKELKLPSSNLIATILLLQLIAIPGSRAFAYASSKIGNAATLANGIALWMIICVGAYYVKGDMQFYLLAACVGFVMGGIQSLSRSTFSKMIPEDSIANTSYFSFYDVTDKLSTVIGTFSYGLIESLSGSPRNSILVLVVYFGIGLVLMNRSRKQALQVECV